MVAVDDSGAFAALTDGDHGREIQTIDLAEEKVVSSVPLPITLQPDAIAIRKDRIIVIGGNEGASVPLKGNAISRIALPGNNVTYVWR